MKYEPSGPFDSIESTHEFFALLGEIVTDTKKDIAQDVEKEAGAKVPRRVEALRLAVYNLEKLELHVARSRRILNDLRSIRRLLFEERTPGPVSLKPKPELQQKPTAPLPKLTVSLSSKMTGADARPHGAAVA